MTAEPDNPVFDEAAREEEEFNIWVADISQMWIHAQDSLVYLKDT